MMNNGLKNIVTALLFITSTLIISQYAHADIEQPTGRETQVTEYFDKQSAPSQIDIWTNESGGHDSSKPSFWGLNTLVCKSSSDPKNGSCATVSMGSGTGKGTIPLRFTEKRSKLSVVLNVTNYHTDRYSQTDYCNDVSTFYLPFPSTANMTCTTNDGTKYKSDGTAFTAYITQTELKKIPFGGIWEASLELYLKQWTPYKTLGNWNAKFALNMSDVSNQAIYFPSFGAGQGKDAQPHVDLNLRPLPSGDRQILGRLSGSTSLDMCLYDGYGSNSRQFQVQLSEPPEYPENPEGRQAGKFSVYNDIGNRNEISNRIDYGVKMYFPESNSFQDVVNGTTYTLPNINTDDIRAVRLASNISNVVLCVPTPLQINTPAFNIVDKTNGHYTGKIRVVFTPSLW